MECARGPWPNNEEYLAQLYGKIARERIPLSGSLELTRRCNLRCVHCYQEPRRGSTAPPEMTTGQVVRVLDEITAAGCLNLLITGGEPMVRSDFGEVYRHARESGLLVSVFSNGTLVTDAVLDLFSDLPPVCVEITVLGATAPTHDGVTGVGQSHERCMSGIRRLLERGVHVKLKTVLMTRNSHEFRAMESLARDLEVGFRFDAAIFPRVDGGQAPLELRVPAQEAVALEFGDQDRAQKWHEFHSTTGPPPAPVTLYQCGAGVNSFHVDAYGGLQPCVMAVKPRYDLLGGDFETGWREVMPRIRDQKADADSACSRCDKRLLCGYCPSFFELETGAEDRPSEYLCEMGRHRCEAISRVGQGSGGCP